MNYKPDNWVVIKINGDDPHYKVLAGWSGGYTTGDSWRMNSGIVSVRETETSWIFHGSSGSFYECNKNSYLLRMNNAHVWAKLKELHEDKVEMMPEDTDWNRVNWIIKPN